MVDPCFVLLLEEIQFLLWGFPFLIVCAIEAVCRLHYLWNYYYYYYYYYSFESFFSPALADGFPLESK